MPRETLARRAPDGAPLGELLEALVRLRGEIAEIARLPARVREKRARLLGARRLRAIEGTRRLALVAPEEVLSDSRRELGRRIAPRLDREVRDAPPRIEHERRIERLGGTRVEAPRARAASLGDRRIGEKREGRHDLAEEDEAPLAWNDHEAVLSDEAEARSRRPRALEEGLDVGE